MQPGPEQLHVIGPDYGIAKNAADVKESTTADSWQMDTGEDFGKGTEVSLCPSVWIASWSLIHIHPLQFVDPPASVTSAPLIMQPAAAGPTISDQYAADNLQERKAQE